MQTETLSPSRISFLEDAMRGLVTLIVCGGVAAALLMPILGQSGLAQQPPDYIDISQSDFEAIDGMVREILEPLAREDMDSLRKNLTKHLEPGLHGKLEDLVGAVRQCEEAAGRFREAKYVQHLSIKNVTDYYVFQYAGMHKASVAAWEFCVYRVEQKWKVVGLRCEAGNPVEFFRFPELQYRSFAK
jgi:hypothetical protein